MHVLVTGGCGFIGSHVALHLREKGHKVAVMDNLVRRGGEKNIAVLERHGVSFFHGDVRNPEDLSNLPSSIELICDTSAQPSVVTGYANPLFDITNNGLGAIHILEYARLRRIPLIFWSSNRVYGADRLNALPRRETPTRFEYDPDAWNRLPVEQRPAGFHPIHGIQKNFRSMAASAASTASANSLPTRLLRWSDCASGESDLSSAFGGGKNAVLGAGWRPYGAGPRSTRT